MRTMALACCTAGLLTGGAAAQDIPQSANDIPCSRFEEVMMGDPETTPLNTLVKLQILFYLGGAATFLFPGSPQDLSVPMLASTLVEACRKDASDPPIQEIMEAAAERMEALGN